MPKNVKGETLGFLTSNLLQNIKKFQGDPVETSKNFEKVSMAKQNRKGPFSLVRNCMLPEEVQFPRLNVTIGLSKFCRTLYNYFGQFVWIEKSHV